MALGIWIGLGVTQGGGGWNPLSLGSSLLAWWDSSQGISLSGSQVTAWADRKNGYSAAQGVSAARPIYSATGFNGMPGLTYDGVDDELTLASQPFPSSDSASEVWAVVQQDALAADATTRSVFSYGDAAVTSQRRLRRLVSTVNRGNILVGTGAGNPVATDTAVDLSSRHLLRAQFGATSSSISVDGNAAVSVAAVPATGTTRARIGADSALAAGQFWHGKIRDVIVTGALSAEQATLLQNFLLARRML